MNILIKIKGLSKDYLFLTLENNGKKEYYLNGYEVEKNSGNQTYLEVMKNKDNIKEVVQITETNKKDVMEYFLRGYDKYVQYIDDYRQWKKQEEHNDMAYQCAKLIDKCVKSTNEEEIKELYKKYMW